MSGACQIPSPTIPSVGFLLLLLHNTNPPSAASDEAIIAIIPTGDSGTKKNETMLGIVEVVLTLVSEVPSTLSKKLECCGGLGLLRLTDVLIFPPDGGVIVFSPNRHEIVCGWSSQDNVTGPLKPLRDVIVHVVGLEDPLGITNESGEHDMEKSGSFVTSSAKSVVWRISPLVLAIFSVYESTAVSPPL